MCSSDLARLFGADPTTLPPETVLAALPTFWARYHDWGDAEVMVNANTADVMLAGYAGTLDVCELVGAELERILELTGAREVHSEHPNCRCRGDAICVFRLHWAR